MNRARAIGWSVGGQFATAVASLLSTVILARLLTPTDYGLFAYALAIYATTQWLLQMGMSQYVLSEAELTPAKLDGVFAMAMIQGLAATAIVAVLAPAAGWFGENRLIGWVTLAVAIVPFLNSPEAISDAYWVRHGRFSGVAILQISKALSQTAVSIAAELSLHLGVFSLVLGLLASSLLSFVVAIVVLVKEARSKPVIDRDQWRVLRRFGARFFALTLGQAITSQAPGLVIGRLLGIEKLGYFNRSSAALDLIGKTLAGATARVGAPRFFREVNSGVPHEQAVAELQELMLFIVWPALAGLAVLAGPIVSLLYGPRWELAAQALPILCLSIAFDQARSGGSEILLVRDRVGVNAWIEAAHAVYAIGFVLIAAPWGFSGVIWARAADAIVTFFLYSWAMQRLGGLPWRVWPRLLGGNMLLAASAAAPAWIFMHHWNWPDTLDFGRFVLAIGASVLAWVAVGMLIRHPYFVVGGEMLKARLAAGRN
ncbi:oligosaccharide flippase family protein [Sphingomonas sp. AP4-R1]|uniref:oligosaccharide flippase family protein n=1 Tax=Sphingomonas sp. AP4-R1 TaxID=2735134 RepID=UPI001493397C|nr:oligosaccharide flippase family protein [Sphingomonas sp. AP4-R1]QJU59813.1 oligosaccharide flippase family protein [Sphingomonas sp. AP4-R1]